MSFYFLSDYFFSLKSSQTLQNYLQKQTLNYGIIICKDDRDYSGQAQTLQNYLQKQTLNLSNCLIRIQKQNQPKLANQIFIVRRL